MTISTRRGDADPMRVNNMWSQAEHRAPRHWPDLLAIAWLFLLAFLYLSPAIKDGVNFGAADVGQGLSILTKTTPPTSPHNNINSDTITEGLPWNDLDWTLVHRGELPLWDSLSGTGLPQLFDFQSAALSLSTIVGYLFPLSMSFLVAIAIKLIVAGTGVYVCCRVLGTRPIAAAFAGTSFHVVRRFFRVARLGGEWAICLGGWILAGIVLAYRFECREPSS